MYPGIVDPALTKSGVAAEYLYVSLGNVCNARCDYCDVHDAPKASRKLQSIDVDRVLREALALGVRRVHFMGGGEPLVAAHFATAITSCNRLRLGVVLTTNGSHLTRRLDGPLGEAALEAIFVSLDSHVAKEHDRVRGLAGLFAMAMEGVRACKVVRPGAKVVLNHVLTCRNVGALRDFIGFAADIGADAVNLIPVKDRRELAPSTDQLLSLSLGMGRLRDAARAFGLSLLCEDADVAHWVSRRIDGTAPARSFRCFFPQRALYVDFATGDVFPCDCTVHRAGETDFCIGSIWKESLQTIWQGTRVRSLRDVLESTHDPGCKMDCDWNNVRTNGQLVGAPAVAPEGK